MIDLLKKMEHIVYCSAYFGLIDAIKLKKNEFLPRLLTNYNNVSVLNFPPW